MTKKEGGFTMNFIHFYMRILMDGNFRLLSKLSLENILIDFFIITICLKIVYPTHYFFVPNFFPNFFMQIFFNNRNSKNNNFKNMF